MLAPGSGPELRTWFAPLWRQISCEWRGVGLAAMRGCSSQLRRCGDALPRRPRPGSGKQGPVPAALPAVLGEELLLSSVVGGSGAGAPQAVLPPQVGLLLPPVAQPLQVLLL